MEKQGLDEYKNLVSIIVPIYNAGKRLEICLQSLLEQSLKEIEIILVDDGSTDDSGKMCDRYSQQDSRFKVLHLQNGGPARARNYGIDIATGKYIGFVDADDYVTAEMFEVLYMKAEQKQSDITMCSYFVDNGDELYPVALEYNQNYEGNQQIKCGLLSRYYTNNHMGLYSLCNKLIRRDMIVENDIRLDDKLVRAEDAWFVFECLKVAEHFSFISEYLYYYYQQESSIMHSVRMDQYEKWVYTRKKLLKENERLGFKIDYHEFYYKFLYDVAIYCKDLMGMGEKKRVRNILVDEFYCDAVKYSDSLPRHIQVLHAFAKYRCIGTAMLCYKIWSKKNAK